MMIWIYVVKKIESAIKSNHKDLSSPPTYTCSSQLLVHSNDTFCRVYSRFDDLFAIACNLCCHFETVPYLIHECWTDWFIFELVACGLNSNAVVTEPVAFLWPELGPHPLASLIEACSSTASSNLLPIPVSSHIWEEDPHRPGVDVVKVNSMLSAEPIGPLYCLPGWSGSVPSVGAWQQWQPSKAATPVVCWTCVPLALLSKV